MLKIAFSGMLIFRWPLMKINPDEQKGNAVTYKNILEGINAGNKKYWESQSIKDPTGWYTSNPILNKK